MTADDLLTRWSARLAMALYVLALAWRIGAKGRQGWLKAGRLCWAAGCLVFLLHVLLAFFLIHHWSHADALAATARRTEEMVGLDWGGGLYLNYVFGLVWLADAAWWWWRPNSYLARSRIIEWCVQGYQGFLAFNATVVFGQGFSRWFGVCACLLLAITCISRRASSGLPS